VSGVNSGGGVVAAPRSWLCYFAGDAMKVEYFRDQRNKVTHRHSSNMKQDDRYGMMSGCVVTKYGIVQVWQYDMRGNSDGYGGMIYVHDGVRWFRQWRKTVLHEKQLATAAEKFAREKFESK